MHQAGIQTAVATCGTALGDDHFDLLRRFTESVVLAFDSDEAGSRAVLRGDELESPFRLDLDVRVAVMPDGLDPADLVQEGRADELSRAVAAARPLLEHRIEHEVSRFDITGPEGRARALHAAASQVRRVNDVIARREYSRFVARLVGVDLVTVEEAVGGQRRGSSQGQSAAERPLDRAESELLRVVLANPEDIGEVTSADFTDERLAAAFGAVSGLTAEPGTTLDITAVSDESASSILRSLAMDERPVPAWADIESRTRSRRLDAEITRLESELDSIEEGTEPHSKILRRLIALQQEKKSLGAS